MVKILSMDGNMAAAHVSYAWTELAAIYPITPSSTMAELVDDWSAKGKKNLFGHTVKVYEMQSEAGAAGVVHGSLKAGALTSTYTASQGLLLMIPNMYKIAGELLPTVFNVSARALATNALSIFGDHSDVMAVRNTGFALLSSSTVQEVMDLSTVAHMATYASSVPFLNFFDGFRTSHEIQKIQVFTDSDFEKLINKEDIAKFKARAISSDNPKVSGTNQNPDTYFQQRETVNSNYNQIPAIVQEAMGKVNKLRGTDYDLTTYYGAKDATSVCVIMGSATSTVEQTVDFLNANGAKTGVIKIHLYRPFPTENFLKKLPKTVKNIAVLDRTKEAGSDGEPLFLDVRNALYESEQKPNIISGRYGIGSKDVLPNQIVAVFDELKKPFSKQKRRFTIGINDDVTNLSLPIGQDLDPTPKTTYQAKFWGFGSDGTVGANKSTIKIIGDNTNKFVQAYFSYDSKKSGGLTVSHLRFGNEPIKSSYLINDADFISCSLASYIYKYDLIKGIKENGIFLLNTSWSDSELQDRLPASLKREIAQKSVQFWTIDAVSIASSVGLRRRTNTIMQTAFFELTKIIDPKKAFELLKENIEKTYGNKSKEIVDSNLTAVSQTVEKLHKVDYPASWATIGSSESVQEKQSTDSAHNKELSKYNKNILTPVLTQNGDSLSVGDFIENGVKTGEMPLGTSAFEKRGIALSVPEWKPDNCISCNECSFVCPHAAIRPFLASTKELENAPENWIVKDLRGNENKYRIQVSLEDCTGCGLCVNACPAKPKALEFISYNKGKQNKQDENWKYAISLSKKENPLKKNTVRGSQFEQPLLEFSGACEGCGETPYVKLLTQLFGNKMFIANATGCSSIWGAPFPVSPYTVNEHGNGPAWSNSLFEDNAEYGYGMKIANSVRRNYLLDFVKNLLNSAKGKNLSQQIQEKLHNWVENFNNKENSRDIANALADEIAKEVSNNKDLDFIYSQKDLFVKPSQWIIGGDGWGYDIGFSGVDHILASGEDVNILVLDNEVYANTGGQASKATPAAAIAKFAASGKQQAKKDLSSMAMSYGKAFVAQISFGANPAQTVRAFTEAQEFNGPSLIIAYTTCISHGLSGGLSNSLTEAKQAVESGYWSLFRYNPELISSGKNPFSLDYKKPDFLQMKDFMQTQLRFSALKQINKEVAESLFDKTVEDAKNRFKKYATLSGDIEK